MNNFFKAIVVCIFGIFLLMFFCKVYIENAYKIEHEQIVFQQSLETQIEPAIIFAIIKEESGFDANAVSKVGAVGLMQIMPTTAISFADKNFKVEELKEEVVNITIGCKYLKYLINKFKKIELAIIAYNAGEGNLLKWIENKKIDDNFNTPFAQTNAYLLKVMDSNKVYKKLLNK